MPQTETDDSDWSDEWSDIREIADLIADGAEPDGPDDDDAVKLTKKSPRRKKAVSPKPSSDVKASPVKENADSRGPDVKRKRCDKKKVAEAKKKSRLVVPTADTDAIEVPATEPVKAKKRARPLSRRLVFDPTMPEYVTMAQFSKAPDTAKRRPVKALFVPSETITLAETSQILGKGKLSQEAALSLIARMCIVSIDKKPTLTVATQEAAKTDTTPALYAAYTTARDADSLMGALYRACIGTKWTGECSADGIALSSGAATSGKYTAFERMILEARPEGALKLVWPQCMTFKMVPRDESKSPMRAFRALTPKPSEEEPPVITVASTPIKTEFDVPPAELEPPASVTVPISNKASARSITVTVVFN